MVFPGLACNPCAANLRCEKDEQSSSASAMSTSLLPCYLVILPLYGSCEITAWLDVPPLQADDLILLYIIHQRS